MGDICSSASKTAHTFKHIYSLPLAHRPKGVLLVYDHPVFARLTDTTKKQVPAKEKLTVGPDLFLDYRAYFRVDG